MAHFPIRAGAAPITLLLLLIVTVADGSNKLLEPAFLSFPLFLSQISPYREGGTGGYDNTGTG